MIQPDGDTVGSEVVRRGEEVVIQQDDVAAGEQLLLKVRGEQIDVTHGLTPFATVAESCVLATYLSSRGPHAAARHHGG